MQYKTGFVHPIHSCPECGTNNNPKTTYSELIVITGMEVFKDSNTNEKHVHDPSYVIHHVTCDKNHKWTEKIYFKCSVCSWSGKPEKTEDKVYEAEVVL